MNRSDNEKSNDRAERNDAVDRPEWRRDARVFDPFSGDDSLVDRSYYLYGDTLEELIFAARYREEPAVAVLEGRVSSVGGDEFVEVTGFSGLQYTGGLRGLQPVVGAALEKRSEQDPSIGLFVARREGGVLIDPEVARVHLSLFNLPHQCLLISDPDTWRVALFARDADGRYTDRAFRIVTRSDREDFHDDAIRE